MRSVGLTCLAIALCVRCAAASEPSVSMEVSSWKGLAFRADIVGTRVHYECFPDADPGNRGIRKRQFRVSRATLNALVDDLGRLGVFSWKPDYIRDVADGQGWTFRASDGTRRIESRGSNAHAPNLSLVVQRIAQLVRPLPFGFGGDINARDCRVAAGTLTTDIPSDPNDP